MLDICQQSENEKVASLVANAYRRCYYWLGQEAAQDLLQEARVTVLEAGGKWIPQKGTRGAYLYSAAVKHLYRVAIRWVAPVSCLDDHAVMLLYSTRSVLLSGVLVKESNELPADEMLHQGAWERAVLDRLQHCASRLPNGQAALALLLGGKTPDIVKLYSLNPRQVSISGTKLRKIIRNDKILRQLLNER